MKAHSIPSHLRFLLPLAGLGLNGLLVLKLHSLDYLPLLQNPAFHPATLSFAALLAVSALVLPWLLHPSHSASGWKGDAARFAIMLAPVAAFFLLPDPTQSAKILADRAWTLQTLAGQRPYVGRKHAEAVASVQNLLPQLAPGEPVDLDLDVLASLASAADSRALFAEVPFRTRAQYLSASAEGRSWKMARLVMVCCVADSRPVVLSADGPNPEAVENDWIEATGHLDFRDGTAVLKISEVQKIDPEEDLFLYGP